MKNSIFKLFKAFFLIIVFQFFYFSHFKNPLNTISLKEWIEIGKSSRAEDDGDGDTGAGEGDEEGNGGLNISPIEAPVSESLHGEQMAYKIQAFAAMATNGALLVQFGSECASSAGTTGSCVMAALSAAQLGLTIWAYLEAEDDANDTEDDDDNNGNDNPDGNDNPELDDVTALINQTRERMRNVDWDVNPQTGEITDPEGNKFKIPSFDAEDLENQGFTPGAIKELQAAKQKADSIAEAAYEAIKEDLTEQLENAEDPENFKFNLSSVGFRSYGGGGSSGPAYSTNSRRGKKGNSFSKFLKNLTKKKKEKKKTNRNPSSLSKYKRLHGKDRIGSRASNLFEMLSHRMKTLKEKKLIKSL